MLDSFVENSLENYQLHANTIKSYQSTSIIIIQVIIYAIEEKS